MMDLPDELTTLSEEEKAERRERLLEESQETRHELEAEQDELLDSFVEEAEVEHIQTDVLLPGGNTATIDVELTGAFLERFEHIEEMTAHTQTEDGASVADISRVMERAASLLADMTAEPKYSKDVFYEVYRIAGPNALGEHIETASKAIERAQKKDEPA